MSLTYILAHKNVEYKYKCTVDGCSANQGKQGEDGQENPIPQSKLPTPISLLQVAAASKPVINAGEATPHPSLIPSYFSVLVLWPASLSLMLGHPHLIPSCFSVLVLRPANLSLMLGMALVNTLPKLSWMSSP